MPMFMAMDGKLVGLLMRCADDSNTRKPFKFAKKWSNICTLTHGVASTVIPTPLSRVVTFDSRSGTLCQQRTQLGTHSM
jgi:hypothetical protein